MRTLKQTILLSSTMLGLLLTAAAQPANPDPTNGARDTSLEAKPNSGVRTNQPDLRLNFRGASLESVLQYFSEAAGFIIDLQTPVKGKVDVWSAQPVSKDEALSLLNSALDKNGYTAVRNGRALTIYTKEDAKKRNLPVKSGNKPEDIPRNEEMVTQIIPVRFINAVQVSRDLQPLLPDKATITANEGGNALVVTDTQLSIHRMAEIIKALDTALASVSSIRVFPLQFADAKAVAGVIKDLFQPQEASRGTAQNQGQTQVVNTFQADNTLDQGAGGPGLGQASGMAGSRGASAGGRAPATRVVAVAEERSNAVVVNAPEEQIAIIATVIGQVDINSQDMTELRVFHLSNADAQETADLLLNLFSDTGSASNQGYGAPVQFGGSLGSGSGSASANQSVRFQKQTKVVAVADPRTGSVVVSAGRELITQIARVIVDLDADASRKQQVYVFTAQNSDAQSVLNILESLIPASNSGSARVSSGQQNGVGSQLSNRASQSQNQRSSSSSGTGGFGGTGGGLGGGSTMGR